MVHSLQVLVESLSLNPIDGPGLSLGVLGVILVWNHYPAWSLAHAAPFLPENFSEIALLGLYPMLSSFAIPEIHLRQVLL